MIRCNCERPIRVLCCPRLSQMGASSRYRSFQYLPYLRKHGFEIEVLPLLDDKYLQVRYLAGGCSAFRVIPKYIRRWLRFRRMQNYDLLWMEKEAFPWIPLWFELMSLPKAIPYVVDYDDAEFHRYDSHWFGPFRSLLGKKIDGVMQNAAMVIAGNEYIAHRAKQAGANRIELLPTVVDLERYPTVAPPQNKVFTIGWIGTPITAKFLQLAAPALQKLCRNGAARLAAIGSGPLALPEVSIDVKPWSEKTEVRDIQEFDVGIMPLSDDSFNHGKCGLKLIQYMACSRPVVGTPLGVNQTIIVHGANGFQADTADAWFEALQTLRTDADLRNQMGKAGRKIVEEKYSFSGAAPKLALLLREAAAQYR